MNIKATLKTLSTLPAATIYEASGKHGDMSPALRQMVPGTRLAGPAFTVRCLPGDFAAVLRAIDRAQRGEVLVIDAGGSERVTALGGTSSLAAKTRGLAGAVLNAACRDLDEIRALKFPVYALGTSVRGTLKNHPGWLQVPVSVGGTVVHPGDFVIGDADGVVVVAKRRLAQVAKKALAQKELERGKEQRVRAGEKFVKMFHLEALEG
ncbi:MAG: RraA family protein [Alphaproteobacteria bacterium]|nr:RraA family protein [Alphaproteobacteria bacterium]